jgi:hypothetical protein
MTRRLALLAALLLPAAGFAQVAGQVKILPAAFGVTDCTNTVDQVQLSWTTSQTPFDTDFYKVYVSTSSACSSTADQTTGSKIGIDFPASSATSTGNFSGGLTRSEFIVASGASCSGTVSPTLWVCVQHTRGTSIVAAMTGNAPLNLSPPPKPVNVSVAPGDGALYVSWADGVSNGVAAASYEVTAVAHLPVNAADTHTQGFTGKVNNRVTGLTNGVEYAVTVRSIAAGSTPSDWTAEVYGTPAPVAGFWELYTDAPPGREQGGCGGGPAGLVSLLGVALVLRGLRRRS